MKIDLLHHWLITYRGGEKVLEQFCLILPDADIHSLIIQNKEELGEIISNRNIKPIIPSSFKWLNKRYKDLLPLYPLIIGKYKIDSDFILSTDASMIKGVRKNDFVPHVCYCHSPPRYLWDMNDDYMKGISLLKKFIFWLCLPYLKKFDKNSAKQVDYFIANSEYVKDRIKRIYDKEATVIHPPVSVDDFKYSIDSEDFYLMISALVPYKRVDLAVDAFNESGKKLIIIGEGPEHSILEKKAKDNIKMLGRQSFEVIKDHYSRCKAFIFPGVEDFGITPLEAQASGKAVIAFKKGGVLETVIEGVTGVFFQEQNVECLNKAIEKFENEIIIEPEDCRKNAERFSPHIFRANILAFLKKHYPEIF